MLVSLVERLHDCDIKHSCYFMCLTLLVRVNKLYFTLVMFYCLLALRLALWVSRFFSLFFIFLEFGGFIFGHFWLIWCNIFFLIFGGERERELFIFSEGFPFFVWSIEWDLTPTIRAGRVPQA